MQRHHHKSRKILPENIEKLERINDAEARAVGAEIARIKRQHVEKYGQPKPMTDMPIKGIVSESEHAS